MDDKELTIEERITRIIVDELAVDDNECTDNADLEHDLGADSLDKAELVMHLEEEFDCAISEENEDAIKTVGDVVKLMTSIVAKKK